MNAEVALFPIPNLVVFPGTVIPLHVFEPRYRTMVHDAVRDERMIGVCHTRKQIHAPRKQQTIEETLASNQATYQPHEIFSAGACEIVETTADGRIHALIHVVRRYRLVNETQTLPYRIVEAEELPDESERRDHTREKIALNDRLIEVIGQQNPALANALKDEAWIAQPAGEFSFKIFQFLRLEPDLMQSILESTRVSDRLAQIDQVLRGVS